MMSKEAIAHYEAALKEAFPRGATGEVFHHWNEARYLIATEALDKMAENARELGLDYEPAQQKPVAWGNMANWCLDSDRVLITDKNEAAKYHRDVYDLTPLYTSPPASRTWVGLSEQERNDLEDYCEMVIGKAAFDAIEAKLKEKNT